MKGDKMIQKFRLGDICVVEKGTYATMKTEPGDYPLVVTAHYRRSASTYQLEGPAVCVPLISSTGHGNAAMHRVHYQEGKFALANLLVALIPKDPNQCSAKYLYHLLLAKKDTYFVPLMQGTANVSLKARDVAGVEVSLPPLSDQQRIVTIMDSVIERVEEAKRERQKIEELSRALLLSEFNTIARTAPLRRMEEVAPLVRRPVEVRLGEQYHELGVRSFGKGTFHKPALDALDVGTKKLFHIEPGDLVFSNVFAWEGAIAVAVPEDAGRVGSHRFITCVPIEGVATAEFLRFYLLTQEGLEKVGEASPGGAGRNRTLGLSKLAAIRVPVPPIDQQRAFDRLQQRVHDILSEQRTTLAQLDGLLPTVLRRAFDGEL